MEYRIITEIDEFIELEQDWEDLRIEADDRLLYTSFHWIRQWWECFGDQYRLFIITVRENGKLVGGAPFFVKKATLSGIPVHQIESVTSASVGDLTDILVAHEDVEAVVTACVQALLERAGSWDALRFLNFLDHSRIDRFAEPALRRVGFAAERIQAPDSWYVVIEGDWDSYYRSRSSNLRGTISNKTRRLQRDGGMEIVNYRKPHEVNTALAEIEQVHMHSWQRDAGCGIFSPRQNDFYRAFAYEAAQKGELDIWLLKLAGKPIAFEYSIIHRGVAYCLKWEYHRAYAKYSPGLVLRKASLQSYFERGLLGCDLLSRYGEMKSKWAGAPRNAWQLMVFSTRLRGRMHRGLYLLRRRLRDVTAVARAQGGR